MEINPLLRISLRARACLQRQHPYFQSQPPLHHLSTSTPTAAAPTSAARKPVLTALSNLSASFRGAEKSPSSAFDLTSVPKINIPTFVETPSHHLHVYSTKHNTHIALTRPDRNPIIAVSTGNLGFRKANRGTYDAAYQLGAYMMKRIRDNGLLTKIEKLELVLRGFGDGREAIKKILLGQEGMGLRPRICRVTDATRLKFGGTRSKKPRRLG